jgi:hypothetical protein
MNVPQAIAVHWHKVYNHKYCKDNRSRFGFALVVNHHEVMENYIFSLNDKACLKANTDGQPKTVAIAKAVAT